MTGVAGTQLVTHAAMFGSQWLEEPLRTFAAVALVLAVLSAMFGIAWLLKHFARIPAELSRKLMHVGMGLVVCSFPWLFDSVWPVAVMSFGSVAALLGVRLFTPKEGLAGVVTGVERFSLGELYFPLAIVAVFWLSLGREHSQLLFTIPILILALGDALATLIGIRYGRLPYQTGDGVKSIEGSLAFFAVTFLTVHVPLLLCSGIGRPECLLIALMLGLLATMLEAFAWRGLDNLFIPVGAFALLQVYLPLGVQALLLRLAVTVLMTAGVFSIRHRTTMDDAGLLAVSFFGYVVAMVGGPSWAIAPLMLFLCGVLLFPRPQGMVDAADHGRTHSARSVFANCAVGAICLLAFARSGWGGWLFPFVVSFAAQLARIFVFSGRPPAFATTSQLRLAARATLCGFAAFLLTCVTTFAALELSGRLDHDIRRSLPQLLALSLCLTVAAAWLFQCLTPSLFRGQPSKLLIDFLGTAASAAAGVWALTMAMRLLPGF